MMDASQVSVENAAAVIGVGLAAAWLAVKKYLSELKPTPAQESADLALLAGSITDMRPVRNVDEKIGLLVVETKRIADTLEKLLVISQERAEDEEIVRRAEILAQNMLKQLQQTQQTKRDTRS